VQAFEAQRAISQYLGGHRGLQKAQESERRRPAVSKFEIIILSAVTILLAVGFFAAFGPGL